MPALDSVLRRDRAIVGAALLAITLAAWLYLFRLSAMMPGMDLPDMPGMAMLRDHPWEVVDRGLDPVETRVADVMTARLVIADADEDYQSAMQKMDQANIRHLPVVSGERLLSMLSIRDLMRVAIEDHDAEIEYLKEYLYQVPPGIGRQSG